MAAPGSDDMAWSITKEIPQGHHNIGTYDYANVETPTLRTREDAPMEAHRRYIDIHIPLDDSETIGWAPTDTLTHIVAPGYDAERDIAFYDDEAHTFWTCVRENVRYSSPKMRTPRISVTQARHTARFA